MGECVVHAAAYNEVKKQLDPTKASCASSTAPIITRLHSSQAGSAGSVELDCKLDAVALGAIPMGEEGCIGGACPEARSA